MPKRSLLWLLLLAPLAGCKGRFTLAPDERFAEQIAMTDGLACGRMKDGSVRCWGTNLPETVRVSGIPSRAVEVATGGERGCAVTDVGGVLCWGAKPDRAPDGPPTLKAAPVAGVRARHVALGARHACALAEGGDVACWGANDAGQLGGEATVVGGATAIAAGGDATCAIVAGRTVTCWGRVPGRAGSGVAKIEGLADVIGIALSETHVCAVKAYGGVACWGENEDGELGDGSFSERGRPVDVAGLVVPAREVAVGRAHTCALLGDGNLRCWGANGASQLANGGSAHSPTPALVQGLFEVQAVRAAGDATCVRFGDGSERCWGGLRLPKTDAERVTVPMEVRW
jgi:hypothetical protein